MVTVMMPIPGNHASVVKPRPSPVERRERVQRPRAAYGTFAGGDIFGLGLEPFSTNAYLSVPCVRSLSTRNACAEAHGPSRRTRSLHARSRPAPGQMHARGRTQCATERVRNLRGVSPLPLGQKRQLLIKPPVETPTQSTQKQLVRPKWPPRHGAARVRVHRLPGF